MKFLKFLFSFVYFIILIYAVFFARRRRHLSVRYVNIVPFKNLINEFRLLNLKESRDVFNYFSNLLGNIALFMPYSFILIVLFDNKNDKSLLLSAFLISVSIELLQYLFCVGVADVDDVLLNTFGALAGILVCRIFKKE
jgi:glycopeptide antibiotics resistance protein